MTFTIEKGIPAPAKRGPNNGFPFAEMVPGDSFPVPVPADTPPDLILKKVCGSVSNYKKRNGGKFTCKYRREEDAVRCWRLE